MRISHTLHYDLDQPIIVFTDNFNYPDILFQSRIIWKQNSVLCKIFFSVFRSWPFNNAVPKLSSDLLANTELFQCKRRHCQNDSFVYVYNCLLSSRGSQKIFSHKPQKNTFGFAHFKKCVQQRKISQQLIFFW